MGRRIPYFTPLDAKSALTLELHGKRTKQTRLDGVDDSRRETPTSQRRQIYVHNPSGKLIDTIDVPEQPSQLLFRGKGREDALHPRVQFALFD